MNIRHRQWSLALGIPLLAALWALPALSSPRTPLDDATVIERLPFRAGDTDAKALAELRARVQKTPNDAESANDLALAYFDLAQARGDPRYVGYADAIVARFTPQMTPDLLLTRGMLLQYRHNFAAALADFAAALALQPERAGAHAWRGAIFLVEAQYANARTECNALQQLQRDALYGGCAGLLQAYTGQLANGYATLQRALASTRNGDQRRWLLTRLGEVAAWQGQPAQAERHYREALALGKDDGYLLAAWADFLLDHQRPVEVVQWLAPWEASDGLLLRLAQAEVLLQLPAAAAHIQALDDRFAAAKLRGDTTHRAEEARFQLQLRHNPALAVPLAVANYQEQKEPRDARVLLESALAAQDRNAAQAVHDWLKSSGFEDPRLRALQTRLSKIPTNVKSTGGTP